MAGWPFWAPTSDDRIDVALRLAGVAPGERLVDLGCGDGRVLVRAALERRARVTGIELDPGLAAAARRRLAEHGVDGDVVEGDLNELVARGIDADVVFAYLSPSTLQRLWPGAPALSPGTRVVTTGYAVPGWVPADEVDRCFLYRVPVVRTPVDRSRRGWSGGGVLVALRPDAPSLVAVKLHHAGGRVEVRTAGGGAGAPTVRTGADVAAPGDEVVVDVRFDPAPTGHVVAAALDAGVGAPFQVFGVVDAGPPGVWGLTVGGADAVGAALAAGRAAAVLGEARQARG